MYGHDAVRIDDSFTYRGLDAVFLENESVRVMVVPEKGGDVLEFRHKPTDVDVLWQADHDWQAPGDGPVPTLDPNAAHDFYPGGWQLHLPLAGYTDEFDGTPYSLHGESALVPWDATVERDDADAVTLRLETDLIRYPFHVDRRLTLEAGDPTLRIEEAVTNEGGVEVPFIWQQHLALGPPLVGPDARLDLPADTGRTADYGEGTENNRLAGGETFDWPNAPGVDGDIVDLREFPPRDAEIDDMAYALDLRDGRYAVVNDAVGLGFEFRFPVDPFECVWYWQPFGGNDEYPFWGRNYNVGIEPTTAYPSVDVPEAQRENGTLKTLAPGETRTASFAATADDAVAFER